jgi:hypothetical protein
MKTFGSQALIKNINRKFLGKRKRSSLFWLEKSAEKEKKVFKY